MACLSPPCLTGTRQINLSCMQIREPWPLARTKQRRREFAWVFDGVPENSLGDGLEIGGGDGFLGSLLVPYCRSFVTTDSYRPRLATGTTTAPVLRRLVCDATSLPFANGSFDFIFSSSVLEHIRARPAALAQMHRCLRPGGVMLHIMPSRTWKTLQLMFYYLHLLLGGLDLALGWLTRPRKQPAQQVAVGQRWSDQRNWELSLRTVLREAIPRVHGEFSGHLSEWRGFGARPWTDEFRAAGFDVRKVLLLPLYSGYGFGLHRLRAWGERMGLSSHNAFVLTRRGEAATCEGLSWFAPATSGPSALSS